MKLTEYQRGILRKVGDADACETSLRRWLEGVSVAGGLGAVAIRLNARLDDLAGPAIAGSEDPDRAADYAIALAAGVMFNRLQQAIELPAAGEAGGE